MSKARRKNVEEKEWFDEDDTEIDREQRKPSDKAKEKKSGTIPQAIASLLPSLMERFQLQIPSLEGDKPFVAIGGDSGYRNLALAQGICWRSLPEFDPSWTKGGLCKKKTDDRAVDKVRAPVHVSAVAHIDLTPSMEFGGDPELTVYHSEFLDEVTGSIAKVFQQRISDMRRAFFVIPSGGVDSKGDELARAIDSVVERLTDTKLYFRLDYALEYTKNYDSPYNITRQLCKTLLHPSMLWLWLLPGEFRMENQVDHLKAYHKEQARLDFGQNPIFGYQKPSDRVTIDGVEPTIWLVANLMQGLLMQMDVLIFGVPRVCRLLAKKYGSRSDALKSVVRALHPTASNEYTIRKLMSVEAVKIFLRATDQLDLFYWITIYLKDKGKSDRDVCDAIALMLESFSPSGTREKAYTKSEREQISAYQSKQREEREAALGAHSDHVDLFKGKKFGLSRRTDTAEYLKKEQEKLKKKLRVPITAGKSKSLFKGSKKKDKEDSVDFFAVKKQPKAAPTKRKPLSPSTLEPPPQRTQPKISQDDQEGLEDMVIDMINEDLRKTATFPRCNPTPAPVAFPEQPLDKPVVNDAGDAFSSILASKRKKLSGERVGYSKANKAEVISLLDDDFVMASDDAPSANNRANAKRKRTDTEEEVKRASTKKEPPAKRRKPTPATLDVSTSPLDAIRSRLDDGRELDELLNMDDFGGGGGVGNKGKGRGFADKKRNSLTYPFGGGGTNANGQSSYQSSLAPRDGGNSSTSYGGLSTVERLGIWNN